MLQPWMPSQRTAKASRIFLRSAMRCEAMTTCCRIYHAGPRVDNRGLVDPMQFPYGRRTRTFYGCLWTGAWPRPPKCSLRMELAG